MSLDPSKLDLKSLVRTIPDYPKKGILFRDITTLIEHPQGFKESIERIAAAHRGLGVTHVAGIEARGFIFGAGVAIALGVGFVPIRKKGKLPGETIGQNYALEYGVDTIEIHADVLHKGDVVLLVDDLIATGGTAIAAVGLLRRWACCAVPGRQSITPPSLSTCPIWAGRPSSRRRMWPSTR